jgi:glycosyltransferase involved in cell wall biosynthesis
MGIEPRSDAATERAPTDHLVLLALGRLVPIKGFAHAIRAVAGMHGVELVIAGEGPERAPLEALARSLGARVRFAGEVRGAEKEALFCAAHAFVLPSIELDSGRTEGMPTTVLEAMEYGLPVIASRTGGVSDVVEHEHNGLLVPAGDERALHSAIEQLRDRAQRTRLGQNARDTAQQFHWDTLAPHFESLLGSRE